ncbi:MAG: 5'/3'-nucleotidase SurE [Cytophagales bacterium]|nr:MAG: 5'/3'-nucleotidase SurE [Cytophagales bacterium]
MKKDLEEPLQPVILVSNDDGISAKGIATLIKIMKRIGKVIVVAPNSPQSGKGHAITIGNTLRMYPNHMFGDEVIAYECSGTPADCVKLAKYAIFHEKKPDLVVSGINHGANSSVSILYSGTMSAAIEAAIEGFPAIGFSLCDFSADADFSHTEEYIEKIARKVIETGLPKGTTLNVNFPSKNQGEIKGIKICRQAKGRWGEEFEQRTDPYGRPYFWLTGHFINEDKGEDTDEWALKNNYISVVPCEFDLTAHYALSSLNEWDW